MIRVVAWPKLLRDVDNLPCRTRREIRTGAAIIPAGMVGRVETAGNGWHLLRFDGDPCKCCGVAPRAVRLSRDDLELIEEEA